MFLGSERKAEPISNPFQGQTQSPKLLRSSKLSRKAQAAGSPLKLLNGDQAQRAVSSPASVERSGSKKRSKIPRLFSSSAAAEDDGIQAQSPSKKRSREILESAKVRLQ